MQTSYTWYVYPMLIEAQPYISLPDCFRCAVQQKGLPTYMYKWLYMVMVSGSVGFSRILAYSFYAVKCVCVTDLWKSSFVNFFTVKYSGLLRRKWFLVDGEDELLILSDRLKLKSATSA